MPGHLAQLGEHLLDVEGVRGSSPLVSTSIPVKSGLNSYFFCIREKFVEKSGLEFSVLGIFSNFSLFAAA